MKKVFVLMMVALLAMSFAVFAANTSKAKVPTVTSNASSILALQKKVTSLQSQVNSIPALYVWAQVEYDFSMTASGVTTLTPDFGVWAEYSFAGFDFAGWYTGVPGPIGSDGAVYARQYSASYTLPNKVGGMSLTTKVGLFRIRKGLGYLTYYGGPIYYAGSGSRLNYLSVEAKTSNFDVVSALNTTTNGTPLTTYVVGSASFSPVKIVFGAQDNFSKLNVGGEVSFKPVTLYAGANFSPTSSPVFKSYKVAAKVSLPSDISLTGVYDGSNLIGELTGNLGKKWSYTGDLNWNVASGAYSDSSLTLDYAANSDLTIEFNVANSTTTPLSGYIAYQISY